MQTTLPEPNPQTKASFTVFVNLFLSLIIKKLLDTALISYNTQKLRGMNIIFLLCLVVILIQSFSLFLKVSISPTYGDLLDVSIRRRFRVPTLFGAMIFVFILLYLLADFFSGSAMTFVIGSVILAFSWLIFDFICKATIEDYYRAKNKPNDVKDDLLYEAVGLWMICDLFLVVWCALVIASLHLAKITERDAAIAMLAAFSFLSYLVLRSVKRTVPNTSQGSNSPNQPSDNNQ